MSVSALGAVLIVPVVNATDVISVFAPLAAKPVIVPPKVKLPEPVTVPVKVRPLTVPVPLTEVTVPPDDGLVLVTVKPPPAAGVTDMPVPAVRLVFFQYPLVWL